MRLRFGLAINSAFSFNIAAISSCVLKTEHKYWIGFGVLKVGVNDWIDCIAAVRFDGSI